MVDQLNTWKKEAANHRQSCELCEAALPAQAAFVELGLPVLENKISGDFLLRTDLNKYCSTVLTAQISPHFYCLSKLFSQFRLC